MPLLLSRFIRGFALFSGLFIVNSTALCDEAIKRHANTVGTVWGNYRHSETATVATGLAADGLLAQYRHSESMTYQEKEAGMMTFINGVMPMEFALYIRPRESDLSLYNGGNSRNFTEILSAYTQYINGYPQHQGVELDILRVRLPERFADGWAATLAKKQPIVLKVDEVVFVQLRIRFKVNISDWLAVQPRNMKKQEIFLGRRRDASLFWQPTVSVERPPTFSLQIRADFGAITGNEELKRAMDSYPLGLSREVGTAHALFQVVDWNPANKGLVMDYYTYRLRYEKEQMPTNSEKSRRLALIQTYQDALEYKPNSESLLLGYARTLEEAGRYGEEIKVLTRLKRAVLKVPRDEHFIEELHYNLFDLILVDGHERYTSPPAQLVKVLDYNITRLRQKSAKSNKTDSPRQLTVPETPK